MKSLSDFKRGCKPGAQFVRRFIGSGNLQEGVCTIAYVQTNAVVFVPPGLKYTFKQVAEQPYVYGSWFYFPPAARCRFANGEIIISDRRGRDYIAFKEVPDIEF